MYNTCAIMELLHKLHGGVQSSGANWVRQHICLMLDGDIQGAHWEMLRSTLPLYQQITTIVMGDGHSTLNPPDHGKHTTQSVSKWRFAPAPCPSPDGGDR